MSNQDFDLTSTPRIFFTNEFSSKKKAIESIASILAEQSHHNITDILEALMNRERIGATTIGNGIAIPHGRISDFTNAMGVLIIIEDGLDIETPDNLPVNILFGLLVPEECNQQHLSLLKGIASIASVENALEMLRTEKSAAVLYQWICEKNPLLGEILK